MKLKADSLRKYWKWKSLNHGTLCNSLYCIVQGILQARILEWVAFPFSRGSSQPSDRTQVSHIVGGFFTSWVTREAWFFEKVTKIESFSQTKQEEKREDSMKFEMKNKKLQQTLQKYK